MDFEFSKDQDMIRETVKKFLENECPKDKVRELMNSETGHDPEMWKKMTEMGWMGIYIPEEYGGTGGEYLDLMIILEEMGRNLFPAPFFSTIALCSIPIIKFGTAEQKKTILSRIAMEGEIWTLALTELSSSYGASEIEMEASLEGDEYVLNGTKMFVPYANVTDNFLVVARTSNKETAEDGITIFIVDAKSPGINLTMIPTTAHNMRFEVKFNNVKVPQSNILGEKDKGWNIIEYILQYATILKCAEMSGGAEAVLELSNNFSKERIQFDKPIGSFQAVQHKLVDMLTESDGLKFLTYEAAWKINIGSPSNMLISMAKAKANNAYQRLCIEGIQIYGAIGFTDEMDIGLYHLQSKSLEFDLGSTEFHREKIINELENQKPLFLSI